MGAINTYVQMKNLTLLLISMLVGFIIVALPDSNIRLFSISKEHGPSLQDAIGIAFILLPYSFMLKSLWKERRKVLKYQQFRIFNVGVFLYGLGTGLIIASVANDYRYWWVYGVALLILVQISIFYIAFK